MSYTKSLLTDQERRELIQKLAAELEAAKAEIDRLRASLDSAVSVQLKQQAEIDRLRHDITGYDAVKRTMQAEIDRLRAENAEFKDALEESKLYRIWHQEAIAEGLVYLREAQDLRDENAKLRALLDKFRVLLCRSQLREQLMNNSPSTASDGSQKPD